MQVNSNNLWLIVKEKHISGLVAFNKSNNQRFCCWKLVKCKQIKKKDLSLRWSWSFWR